MKVLTAQNNRLVKDVAVCTTTTLLPCPEPAPHLDGGAADLVQLPQRVLRCGRQPARAVYLPHTHAQFKKKRKKKKKQKTHPAKSVNQCACSPGPVPI